MYFNKLPSTVKYVGNGVCDLTITLPEKQINNFLSFLESMGELIKGITWRAKNDIDSIHERIEQQRPEMEKNRKEFENAVCKTYQGFIDRGETPRAALSISVAYLKQRYEFSTFNDVNHILTHNKLLKKTGFYKNR